MTEPGPFLRVDPLASDALSEAFLEVRGLSKSYDTGRSERLQVLENVNLSVARGQLVAVVGASGSGKSTLLHMLGALDRPDDGEVLISGHSIFSKTDEDLSAIRNRHVGFVFQFHHLLPEFSALENVMMPALIARENKSTASIRATELLQQFGLAERLEHRPGELSGGEKQRVAIARALMNDPDIVLADEPTGNLDQETADVLHQEIVRLAREMGQTVVVVTHNVEFATMADRRLRLEGGHLSEQT